MDLNLYIHKTNEAAVIPEIAYNGTSAAFDITCTETTEIKPGESKVVPNGLRISIDEKDPFYMTVHLRSSLGFKKDLIPHIGIIDAGYTGDFGVKINNIGKEPIVIEKGSRYAQVLIHRKYSFKFVELNDSEFEDFEAKQERGSKGFGSSGKS